MMMCKYFSLAHFRELPGGVRAVWDGKRNGHLRANPTAKLSRGDGEGTPLTRTGVCQYARKVGALRQAGWHRRKYIHACPSICCLGQELFYGKEYGYG